ncbi:hypothetical protein LUZ60_006297 [Juncus effusus]|nr:hypothetical protein LUZ60_006297 [Juncus effusus]
MAMGFGGAAGGGVPSTSSVPVSDDMGFFSDTVHYNPSDLSTWLDSMLTELNTPPPPPPPPPAPSQRSSVLSCFDPAESSTVTFDPNPISPDPSRERKRMRTGSGSGSCSSSSSSSLSRGGATGAGSEPVNPAPVGASVAPIVVVDPQEAGIRLVHALMACAEAVQQDNLKAADALVKQISILASSQGGAMRKVATYFGEALARRIYRVRPAIGSAAADSSTFDSSFADILYMHFYETCPYLKFAHFTANQAILEAFAGYKRVHVIDFGIKQGMQWPALLQALALRPGGPPSFRLTGIGPDHPENSDSLHQVGMKLAQFAHSIQIDFKYRVLVANSLAELKPYLLEEESSSAAGEPPVAVAVNSVCELHQLLARSGELDKVFETIHKLKPKIITVVEQEASHNNGSFSDRFTESLHYYSTMFDSLESSATSPAGDPAGAGADQDQLMSELYLGRQICNIVSCEGSDRTERHETLLMWRTRFSQAGFEPVHLGSNAFKQASTLLALFAGGDGYRVEEKDGCLTLGWHTRPLIATSAWRIATSA